MHNTGSYTSEITDKIVMDGKEKEGGGKRRCRETDGGKGAGGGE
jgi:hypothetical protein